MGIQTLGLLLDRNFGDIINPTTALNNLLTTLASGAVYLKEDLDFLQNISQINQGESDEGLPDVLFSLDSQLKKLLNIVQLDENNEIIRPIPTIKNRFDFLNLIMGEPQFQGGNGLTRRTYEWSSVYSTVTSIPQVFDSSVFLDGPQPVETDIFWGRGSISFKDTQMSLELSKIEGIQTFTGFLKSYQSGIHTFRITSGTNGGVVIELTNEKGQSMLSTPTYYKPNYDNPRSLVVKTLPLEKYKFYNIKIYFLRSPEAVKEEIKHSAVIIFELPQTFNTSGVFYYDFLYDENYLSRMKGVLGNFYNNKLPIMGTNFHSYENNIEQFSVGGREPASYKAVLTTGALTVNYTPPKLYSTSVIYKTGNLSANRNFITNIDDTSNIQVGNLVLNGSKSLSSFTYVKEIIDESSVFLTKESPVNASSEQLYFIKHKGLKGYTQDYDITTGGPQAIFKNITNYKGVPYKPKDVALHESLTVGGFTSVSAISSNGNVIINRPFLNVPVTNRPLVFYYRSGIDNISLDGFCKGGNVLKLITARTNNTSPINTNLLYIDPDSIFDYEGNKISLASLPTTNAAISAYQINYDAAIPSNTSIIQSSTVPNNTITLSKNLNQAIRPGTALSISLSTPSNPPGIIPRYECFPPGETVSPFIGTTQGIATPTLSSVTISNKTATFNNFVFIDNDEVFTNTNIFTTSPTSNINALIPVKDVNNLTLFLLASTGNVNSTTTTTTTTTVPPWVQVTPTLSGEVVSFSRFGWSVDINGTAGTGDEYIIAGSPTGSIVGFTSIGRSEIYKRTGGTSWTRVDVISGANTNEQRGFSVKLNDSGLVAIVGAPCRHITGTSSTATGHGGVIVRGSTTGTSYTTLTSIYDTSTLPAGTTVDTSNKFGWSVDINGNGSRIVVGAPGVDITPNTNVGRVRVYNTINNNVSWSQLGNDIVGENANDECGYSVTMNTAGNILAATSLYRLNNNLYGRVRVFQHNGESPGTWSRMGNSIDGPFPGYYFGNSIALNSAGDIIVIGAPNVFTNSPDPGIVRVYKYNSLLNAWIQYGQDIIGTGASSNQFGDSVSINNTGDRIVVGAAVGAPGVGVIGIEKGQSKIYRYNSLSQTWNQLSNSIEGDTAGDGSGYSVSMNSGGNRIAIGAPYVDYSLTDQGNVKVYSINI